MQDDFCFCQGQGRTLFKILQDREPGRAPAKKGGVAGCRMRVRARPSDASEHGGLHVGGLCSLASYTNILWHPPFVQADSLSHFICPGPIPSRPLQRPFSRSQVHGLNNHQADHQQEQLSADLVVPWPLVSHMPGGDQGLHHGFPGL